MHDTIDKVLKLITPKYVFDIFSKEDLYQEGYIMALEGVKLYNPKSGASLETFLFILLSNKFKNLKRKHCGRATDVCNDCNEYNPECIKCQNRKNTHDKRKNLLKTINIFSVNENGQSNLMVSDEELTEINELQSIIDKEMPVSMRQDYLLMKEGRYIVKQRRQQIEEFIYGVLGDVIR